MLTYTFSTREKVLLALLAFVAIIIAWYQLVFVNIQNQVNTLNSEIAAAQDEFTMNQSRAAAMTSMKNAIEDYEAKGFAPVHLPNFDNTQNLMAYLNGVLATSTEYSMSFDNPELSEDDGTVHRVGTITYGTTSYEEARSIAQNIARGPYPCQIDALQIADSQSQRGRSGGAGGSFTSNLQVTFFEKPTGNLVQKSDKNEVKGQDLSKMSDWNK